MKYRIINGLLLLYSDNKFYTKKDDLFINGTKIEAIGKDEIKNIDAYEVVDAENQLIMPGLINTHTHVYMNFMKNSADDVPFNTWLFKKIFPIEAKMEKHDFYWTTLLGIIEMIKTGTTCYLDMHICENECARAANDAGVRAFIGKCITGTDLYSDGYEDFKGALEEKDNYESELIKFVLSPHSVYACSPKLLLQISEEAAKRNMLKHIHLSESEKEVSDCLTEHCKTPVELLADINFLDDKTIAAHCVKLRDRDINIFSDRRVNVVTNPSSNAKLGNGIALVPDMIKSNINVCLGTDSAASNNTLNMFREMGVFSLLHKAHNESATVLDANSVLKCATVNPAKAFGMGGTIGQISKGAAADLVFVDLRTASLFPNNDIVSSLCYSANGSEISSVMINGRFVMQKGVITTIDTERVYCEIQRITEKYI